ncbi:MULTISPECIES: hypothetical protein [Lonsdalea]|uniref:Uncharacterized protein n=2 Tax=Lonsdalea TaxID=1082702 RepID=A0ACD1J8V9_9GAMM|nr:MULTISPECIES: hypothetical protein [Lonsdalea]OSM93880.1 hypothetical protein AU499_16635 [Lonsdalea populi]QPQ23876.1 hypothetical protein I6N93_15020 [Lonsdalea populi]RAT09940.1 hypothetical protein AU485_17055 [Lonsdalea quercina]RAT16062.1 hypothetical protein AU487_17130 [Lonsdalea populi]RAT18829.1 hypothetical protein AU488_16945 [Lonsdalea populi]
MAMVDMQYGENEMTLCEIINQINSFDHDETIYVKQPWRPDSEAIVAAEPMDGKIPDEAAKINAEYFLEIFLAKEFLEGWLSNLNNNPSWQEQCFRLIEYAETDA